MGRVEYVVTDPCWLLSLQEWDDCLDYDLPDEVKKTLTWIDDTCSPELDEYDRQHLEEALKQKTGYKAWVHRNYAGDVPNKIKVTSNCGNVKIIKNDFSCDSGFWCICRKTDEVDRILDSAGAFFLTAVFQSGQALKTKLSLTLLKSSSPCLL